MKLLSGILGLTLTSVVALASANAADIYRAEGPGSLKDPVYPVTSWTGFYVGVNGGYAFSDQDQTVTTHRVGDGFLQTPGAKAEGGFGGGQIGYNWQGGYFGPRVVLGIEADIQGADINDRVSGTATDSTGGVDRFDNRQRIDYFGTVRGRIGYGFDRTLVYATGGFAYGDVKNRLFQPGILDLRSDQTETGYVVGAGFEYKVSPAWSLKAEYQYIDLGSEKLSGPGLVGGTFVSNDIDARFHTVRVGLNYHIHQEYEPLK